MYKGLSNNKSYVYKFPTCFRASNASLLFNPVLRQAALTFGSLV